ncbi:MAG: hypothetical protein ACTHMM_24500, partial [Agriterribacter sp.]
MKCYREKLVVFTEEEFAADEYFQQWVLIPDDENEAFWKSFIEQYPAQRIPINNARKLVVHLADTGFHVPNLSAEEKQSLREGIFEKLDIPPAPELPAEPGIQPMATNKKMRLWIAAASARTPRPPGTHGAAVLVAEACSTPGRVPAAGPGNRSRVRITQEEPPSTASATTVVLAFAANIGVAIAKTAAAMITLSAAMVAEAAHS